MKAIERFELIDRIARELQSRMGYDDIQTYLEDCGITAKPKSSSFNSKWVYAKELLAKAPEQIIIRIADELHVPHGYTIINSGSAVESNRWEANHFRLFFSHVSSFKIQVAKLRTLLRKFAISGFVAHEDIEPTKEWEREIEAALFSMDALAAIVTPNFFQSKWTDQEVGIAIGRRNLVIPVMRDAIPHGFIGKFQGINGKDKSVAEVAKEIFEVLLGTNQTRSRLLTCIIDATVLESNEEIAVERLQILASIQDVPTSLLERLREGAGRSQLFRQSKVLGARVAELLQAAGIDVFLDRNDEITEDDIPF